MTIAVGAADAARWPRWFESTVPTERSTVNAVMDASMRLDGHRPAERQQG